ncbi:hypothetical protein ACFLZY_01260 [Patescibacteria group bacterium]
MTSKIPGQNSITNLIISLFAQAHTLLEEGIRHIQPCRRCDEGM